MDKWRHSAVYICVFSDACLKTYIFVRASSMNTDSTRDDTVVAWKILGLFMNPETDISITNQSDRPAAVKSLCTQTYSCHQHGKTNPVFLIFRRTFLRPRKNSCFCRFSLNKMALFRDNKIN